MKQQLPGSGEKPLDRWLRELMPGKSWNEVRRLARTGKIFVDGTPSSILRGSSPGALRWSFARTRRALHARRRYRDSAILPSTRRSSSWKIGRHQHGAVRRERARHVGELVMETSRAGTRAPRGIVHASTKRPPASGIRAHHAARPSSRISSAFHPSGARYVAIAHGTDGWHHHSRLVQDRGDGRRGSTDHTEMGREAITHVKWLESLRGAASSSADLETGRTIKSYSPG